MEKYARQCVSEGLKNVDDIHVGLDSEIYRVLNLHYNRNNHIEVSLSAISEVVNTYGRTQFLKEFLQRDITFLRVHVGFLCMENANIDKN